jgi:hypothetical protein
MQQVLEAVARRLVHKRIQQRTCTRRGRAQHSSESSGVK